MTEMPKSPKDRAEWYDRNAELPDRPETKIKMAPKAKGMLSTGFNKLDTPKQPEQAHAQTKSERDSVGSRWRPGPGNQHKGKASPSSEESFLKQAKNKESSKR
jgi:hypothetical protein